MAPRGQPDSDGFRSSKASPDGDYHPRLAEEQSTHGALRVSDPNGQRSRPSAQTGSRSPGAAVDPTVTVADDTICYVDGRCLDGQHRFAAAWPDDEPDDLSRSTFMARSQSLMPKRYVVSETKAAIEFPFWNGRAVCGYVKSFVLSREFLGLRKIASSTSGLGLTAPPNFDDWPNADLR